MFDRYIEISAQIVNPNGVGYTDNCLAGQSMDELIFPVKPFSASLATEDIKFLCEGGLYTANGWDGTSGRGLVGASKYNYAQFWSNSDGLYRNAYIHVGPTGSLEFLNKFGVKLAGHYKVWVPEQTGKRYTVP